MKGPCPVCGQEDERTCPVRTDQLLPWECLIRSRDRLAPNVVRIWAGPGVEALAGVIEQVRAIQRPAAA